MSAIDDISCPVVAIGSNLIHANPTLVLKLFCPTTKAIELPEMLNIGIASRGPAKMRCQSDWDFIFRYFGYSSTGASA